MADISEVAKQIYRGTKFISSGDSARQISEWVNNLRFAVRSLPETDYVPLITMLGNKLDSLIRESVANRNLTNIGDFLDYIQKYFGAKRSIQRIQEDITHMRKLSSENYTRFGNRILGEVKEASLIIDAEAPVDERNGRKKQVEECALRTYIKNIRE